MSHAWGETGTYSIRARARDARGALSAWSDAALLLVHAPRAIPKWIFRPGTGFTTPAIGSDGTIYTSGNGTICALHPDGSLRWELPVSAPYLSAVALSPDDVLYVGAEDSLRVLNPDGSTRWAVRRGSRLKPAIAANGTIYGLGSVHDTSCLIAYDIGGSMLWHTPVPYCELPLSIAPDGTIYFAGDYPEEVAAFYPSGETRWYLPLMTAPLSACTIDRDGTAYVGTHHDGGLSALTSDGHMKWQFAHSEESFPGGVAIGPDGTLYGGEICCDKSDGEYDIYFYAINPDGSVKWRYCIDDWDETTPAVCADGTVYFGTSGTFYALDATGRAKWYCPEMDCLSPAVGPDGTVYVAGNGIYAFPGTSPLASSPWPKYGCDARNSSCAIGR